MKRKLSAWLVIVMLLTAVLPINMLAEEEIYVDDTAIETFDDVEEVEELLVEDEEIVEEGCILNTDELLYISVVDAQAYYPLDADLVLTLQADAGYALPAQIGVVVDGLDVSEAEEIVWDAETATLTVPAALLGGEVSLIAEATEVASDEEASEEEPAEAAEPEAPEEAAEEEPADSALAFLADALVDREAQAAPVFTVQPTDQAGPYGEFVTYSAAVTDADTLQWEYNSGDGWKNLRESATIIGVNTDTLQITVSTNRSKYSIRLAATNAAGTVYSDEAHMTIATLPVFTVQPTDQTGPYGEFVTYSAAVTDADTLQWQYNSGDGWKNLRESATIIGVNTDTLQITVSTNRSKYSIRLAATNAAGTVYSDEAHMTIATLPVFTVQPTDQAGAYGEFVTYAAAVTDADTLQWQYNSGDGWKNLKEAATIVGVNTDTLQITVSTNRSKYSIRLAATNAGGTVYSDEAHMTILSKPVFTEQPTDQEGVQGEFVTYAAAVTNADTLQWQYNSGDGWKNLREAATIIGVNTDTLQITVSVNRAKYSIRLAATNAGGTAYSDEAHMMMLSKPVFTEQPTDQAGLQGEFVTYAAAVTNADTLQWQYNSGDGWKNLRESATIVGVTTDTLQITVSGNRAKYSIRLAATNVAGTVYSDEAHMRMLTLPKFTTQPTDQEGVQGEFVTYAAAVTNADTLQWQYNSGDGWKNLRESATIIGVATDTLQMTVSVNRAKYSIRLAATNEGGTVYSDEVGMTMITVPTFNVQPTNQEAKLTEFVTYTAEVNNADTLQWQYNSGDGWKNLKEAATIIGVTTDTLQITVSKNRSAYFIRLAATNDAGTVYSDEVQMGVLASSVTLTQTEADLVIGDTLELGDSIAINPGYATNPVGIFTSSDETVATVDETGLVTAIAEGTATITYKLYTGTGNEEDALTATIEITVLKGYVGGDFLFNFNDDHTAYIVVGYTGTASTVTIPDVFNDLPVLEIDAGVFEGHTEIVSVSIPNAIIRIGARAFADCTSLSEMIPY